MTDVAGELFVAAERELIGAGVDLCDGLSRTDNLSYGLLCGDQLVDMAPPRPKASRGFAAQVGEYANVGHPRR